MRIFHSQHSLSGRVGMLPVHHWDNEHPAPGSLLSLPGGHRWSRPCVTLSSCLSPKNGEQPGCKDTECATSFQGELGRENPTESLFLPTCDLHICRQHRTELSSAPHHRQQLWGALQELDIPQGLLDVSLPDSAEKLLVSLQQQNSQL